MPKPIPIYRAVAGPPALRLIFEHHQYLWHLSRAERQAAMADEAHDGRFGWWHAHSLAENLAGWCTQVMASGHIRSGEIARFLDVPSLDKNGPFGSWLEGIERRFPILYSYIVSVELMRLLLVDDLGPGALGKTPVSPTAS